MQSHIRVAVRIRPFLPDEPSTTTVSLISDNTMLFDPKKKIKDKRAFQFDSIFGEKSTNAEIYQTTGKPLIDHALEGFNVTLFSYGATGCGKTHTIMGSPSDLGLTQRALESLFEEIKSLSKNCIIKAYMSYLEVYNEQIRDLLSDTAKSSNLDIREGSTRVEVAGLTEYSIKDVKTAMNILLKGNEKRVKAFTLANANSSRSHAVLQIRIERSSKAGDTVIKQATISIIDLAGSERATATHNQGIRLHEGAKINRSLLALGNCINALCSTEKTHIPYRDSKLTRLLKYSLNGNCMVLMIVNISPSYKQAEETLNSLKYANRAKEIKTNISQNTSAPSDIQYSAIIQMLREEIESMRKSPATNSITDPKLIQRGMRLLCKIENEFERLCTIEIQSAVNEFRLQRTQAALLALLNETKTLEEQRLLNPLLLLLNERMDDLVSSSGILSQKMTKLKEEIELKRSRLNSFDIPITQLDWQEVYFAFEKRLAKAELSKLHSVNKILLSDSVKSQSAFISSAFSLLTLDSFRIYLTNGLLKENVVEEVFAYDSESESDLAAGPVLSDQIKPVKEKENQAPGREIINATPKHAGAKIVKATQKQAGTETIKATPKHAYAATLGNNNDIKATPKRKLMMIEDDDNFPDLTPRLKKLKTPRLAKTHVQQIQESSQVKRRTPRKKRFSLIPQRRQ